MLDVGAGTGKATLLFARRGASVLALEPDAAMAAIARRNTAELPNVEVRETTLEAWTVDEGAFDIVISAQAWHWMTPDLRTQTAHAALRNPGVLALFWSRPDWTKSDQAPALHDAYEQAVPDFGTLPGPMHPAHQGDPWLWGEYADELDAAHGFASDPVRRYDWATEYTRDEYLSLIGTHSDHIVLEPEASQRLRAAVGAAIDATGGRLVVPYATFLWIARPITA